jgi:ketosteroid isomerase-like protein
MLFAYRAISRSSTMKLAAPCLAALLITSMSTGCPGGAEPDPFSVVQALMDAQSAIDPDAALALFADDAVIVNVTGDKFAGDDLRRFVQTDTWANDRFAMESPRLHGDKVVWTKSVTAGFYQHLGIAPVQFAFEATVRAGRITSINAYFPPWEIARIEQACRARAIEPLIYGRPCSEFVRGIKAHTRNSAGTSARVRREPFSSYVKWSSRPARV